MFKSVKKIFVTSLTFVFLLSAFTLTASAAQDMKNMNNADHKKMQQAKKDVKKPAAKKPVAKKPAAKKPVKKN
ncbi:MAG: hypothetical protein M0Z31_11475 [Clostridia bacterium]|nr:hypothetical protein [Clostridia bacterium]